MLRAFLTGLLVLATGPSAPEAGAPSSRTAVRYALIPPRNLSGVDSAPDELLGRLVRALENRGAVFVTPADIDQALRERRVRYTDSLGARDLAGLADSTGANYTMLATIFDCTGGLEPRLSFSLRALDNSNGRRALSSAVALRGVDFEGMLGLGRIEDFGLLADEAIARVLERFDEHGAPRGDLAGSPSSAPPKPPDGGFGFVREEFDLRQVERIAVLPFSNRTDHSDAAAQFSEFLGDAWFHSAGVQVVEAADLRAELISRKVRSMQFLDFARLAELGKGIGVRYFVLGSIDRWGDEVLVNDQRFPEVETTVQIVDAESGRIVAAASLARRGSDYVTILGLGAVHDPAGLALRAATEIVTALGG